MKLAGIDTGGTFTDLVIVDRDSGRLEVSKAPSTPGNPAQGVFDAFDASGTPVASVDTIVLGTTIATNALIERAGARVVYVTTAGFEDVPLIGRVDKRDPYDLHWEKPQALFARTDRVGVAERVDADGQVLLALTDEEIESTCDCVAKRLEEGDERPTAIAVNLLFAFANPEHESRIAAALRERFEGVPVSASHEVSPVWREYERGSTTILDAYLTPVVRSLTDVFEAGLRERGFSGGVSIMKSNGGQMLSETASEQAVETVLSGLAGGIVAGRYFGELAGESSVITLDMGGTSADIGIIREGEIAHVQEFELEFGMPIVAPAIDLVTIGAGGGSIAWIDDGGLLRVGPRSAGAVPGPVCYGRGGEEPTVTDANLVLGRLDPDFFLGGRIKLDRAAAERAITALGRQLCSSTEETARAIIEIASESMAAAIRRVAVDRGLDPRDFTLVAFGGAGPLHASEVAEALGSKAVLIPPHPGLASAYGTLSSDRRVDRRWTRHSLAANADLGAINERLEAMAEDCRKTIAREGYVGAPLILRSISMRYAGQNYERDVPIGAGELDPVSLARLIDDFHEVHERFYGYSLPGEEIELIHFNVAALGPTTAPPLAPIPSGELLEPGSNREIDFGDAGVLTTPVYRRDLLPENARLLGPAVIEEGDSTTLVLPGQELVVDPSGILRAELRQGQASRSVSDREVDSVTLSIIGDQLVSITQEMGSHMMRSSYSPIFSESRDFSCALFDRHGLMVAQGPFCPAQLGAISETVRCVIDELGTESFGAGDVVVHNDPYRGGCHMPEHMLLGPIFWDDQLVGFAATIGHLAEIGAATVGSFVSDATEVFQEGLRLPPVKLERAGEPVRDIWQIILANHRTPRNTWGDLHAMIGSLRVAEARVQGLVEKYGLPLILEATDELIAHGERMMRKQLESIPDGQYTFEDEMEDDGVTANAARIKVTVSIDGDRAIVDYTGSDPQAEGPVNATFGVTTSATYNAFLQLSPTSMPRNAGAYRCLKTIAPVGSVVNVRYPGPSVGGNTETQPKLVGMILGALAEALPDRVMAAEGVTSCNFLFGGVDPRNDQPYAHYHFEASGWGGRADADGNDAQNHIHGNCRNAPIEVLEARFPVRVASYELVPDSGGPGRYRGGLAVRRMLEMLAPDVTVSAMMDRVKQGAWGLFGGQSGRRAAITVKRRADGDYQTFSEAFDTVSPSKFAGIHLRAGDKVILESAGGGGFGAPSERAPDLVLRDVKAGVVSVKAARDLYGVSIDSPNGNGALIVDMPETERLRQS